MGERGNPTIMERKYNILVIDDDISTIQVISMILNNAGYMITADPTAELEFLSTGKNPDLLLMDNQVGEKCGATICFELKRNEKTRHMPVILFSGVDNLEELAGRACADDYIAKPFGMTTLLQKVEFFLQQKAIAC